VLAAQGRRDPRCGDSREAARRILDACASRPDVAAADLFGSALRLCRPDSAIDVGVVRPAVGESAQDRFKAGLRLGAELMVALGAQAGPPFEVSVRPQEQPLFSMPVVRDGHLCCVGRRASHADFLKRVARAYGEDAPRHERAGREVREGWAGPPRRD